MQWGRGLPTPGWIAQYRLSAEDGGMAEDARHEIKPTAFERFFNGLTGESSGRRSTWSKSAGDATWLRRGAIPHGRATRAYQEK